MFRWRLNSYSFVVYSPNRATVSFYQTFSISHSSQQLRNRQCLRRLTISWNQFNNLNLKKSLMWLLMDTIYLLPLLITWWKEHNPYLINYYIRKTKFIWINYLCVNKSLLLTPCHAKWIISQSFVIKWLQMHLNCLTKCMNCIRDLMLRTCKPCNTTICSYVCGFYFYHGIVFQS